MSQLLAALAEVDGAVLLTDSFEVLGFGGEIVGGLREIRSVRRALDLEGTTTEEVPIDHVGTRHRSAYRLCAQEPSAIAIVVSHDGGVQFVASRDGQTTYWEHVPVTGAENLTRRSARKSRKQGGKEGDGARRRYGSLAFRNALSFTSVFWSRVKLGTW